MTHLTKYPFLAECSVLELAALAKEANEVGDTEFRKAVLLELRVRETGRAHK